MKQSILFTFFLFMIGFTMQAQNCTPDEIYRDSAIGVYPPPWTVDRPTGGIQDSACLNTPFEFALTFKIPETFSIGPVTANIESIDIATTGAIGNLPSGMAYVCNPPSCSFTPLDTIACLLIYGTPDDAADFGSNELTLTTFINTNLLDQEIVFPNNDFEGADGVYDMYILPEGSPQCDLASSAHDILQSNVSLKNNPNPFSYYTTIEIESRVNGQYQFEVFDLLGQRVHVETVQLIEGTNQFEYDGSQLSNGMYLFTVGNTDAKISSKMLVNR